MLCPGELPQSQWNPREYPARHAKRKLFHGAVSRCLVTLNPRGLRLWLGVGNDVTHVGGDPTHDMGDRPLPSIDQCAWPHAVGQDVISSQNRKPRRLREAPG